eukprot:6931140-Pyramimonas_sp.AAC.1
MSWPSQPGPHAGSITAPTVARRMRTIFRNRTPASLASSSWQNRRMAQGRRSGKGKLRGIG